MAKIQKLLIANRGEIACRVMRTARTLGLHTVAIYSQADQNALHVRLADEAYLVGPAAAAESYLDIQNIISVAKVAGVDAIHPGYGFLSENPAFAEACAEAGIIFIGPSPDAMRAMGNKSRAKEIAEKAGIPEIPGFHGKDQSEKTLLSEAQRIGFPLMIKAALGGGGKGIRIVDAEGTFLDALVACQREAQSSFGDGTVLLEKYMLTPRHVEVQIFGDHKGNILHLFERDCSLQRRYQKILEEAPAFGISEDVLHAMRKAAIALAQVVQYVGAGTVEFLVDQTGIFYFMEMNTRLQVEHPVTETITGLDLVEWQIRVAQGESLPLSQDQIQAVGHAVELRLYAEDPEKDFLPQTGTLAVFDADLPGARIDSGVEVTSEITPFYDPLIAKLIVKGQNRGEAFQKAREALEAWRVGGVKTNQAFLLALLSDSRILKGQYDVGFLDRTSIEISSAHENEIDLMAALSYVAPPGQGVRSPWDVTSGWSLQGYQPQWIQMICDQGREVSKTLTHDVLGWTDGQDSLMPTWAPEGEGMWHLQLTFQDQTHQASLFMRENMRILFSQGHTLHYVRRFSWESEEISKDAEHHLKAPMAAKVIAVKVQVGDRVAADAPLLILEAMKMEHTVRAARLSKVKNIFYHVGESVEEGADLIELNPLKEDSHALAETS